MRIQLTNKQLDSIKNRLEQNIKEEKELREKDKRKEYVNGWDFASLSDEKYTLEKALKDKYVDF